MKYFIILLVMVGFVGIVFAEDTPRQPEPTPSCPEETILKDNACIDVDPICGKGTSYQDGICVVTENDEKSSSVKWGKGLWNRDIDSPLKQIQSGIPFNEIQCNEDLVLIQKYDGSPACVTESTKTKLIERGWTSKDSTVSVNECEKGVPPGDDLVFFDCKWVEVPYGWTYENGQWQEDPAILKLGPEPEPSCPEDTVCTCDGKYGFYNKTTNRCDSSPYMPQYYQRNCEQYADLDYEGWTFDAKECDWNQLND